MRQIFALAVLCAALPAAGAPAPDGDPIDVLLRRLAAAPPAAVDGLKRAILGLRSAARRTDDTPISIRFTSPADGSSHATLPAIVFEMTDAASGPDPESRHLTASFAGGVADLTPYTQVQNYDPVTAFARIAVAGVPAGTLPAGTITLTASGTDLAGNAPSQATVTFVLGAAPALPGPFTLLAPGNATSNVSTSPTYSWSASAGAATYTLQVSGDAAFSSFVVDQPGIAGTSFTAGPLANATTYFWRVTAFNAAGSRLAGPWSFSTSAAPPAPPGPFTLLAPANASSNVATTPTYSWSASADAASYTLQVSGDAAFSSFVVNQPGIAGTSFTAGPLANATTYFWRVLALNGAGSRLSSPFSFTTAAAGNGPTITSVAPTSGAIGSTILIQGSGLAGAVTFSPGVAAEQILEQTATQVLAVVPPGAQSGPLTVGASNAVPFTVVPDFFTPPASLTYWTDGDLTFPSNQLLVSLWVGFGPADAQALATSLGAAVTGYFPASNSFTLTFNPPPADLDALLALMNQVSADPRVAGASRNLGLEPFTVDTHLRRITDKSKTWAYDRIQLQSAYDTIEQFGQGASRTGLLVAVIDQGFCINPASPNQFLHPQFQQMNGNAVVRSFVTDPAFENNPGDNAHGTAVAGIIGASNFPELTLNNPDVPRINGILSGMDIPFTLHVWRAPPRGSARASVDEYIVAIQGAARSGARVINMSTGITVTPQKRVFAGERALCYRLLSLEVYTRPHVLFVWAAGNDGIDADDVLPAGIGGQQVVELQPGVPKPVTIVNTITVGGTDKDDARWRGSNKGAKVSIAAPAENVYALSMRNNQPGYTFFGGTSAAAPMVSGTAALLWALYPDRSVAQIKALILDNADPISDVTIGGRRLNICRSVAAILGEDPKACCGRQIVVSGVDQQVGGGVGFYTVNEDASNWTFLGGTPSTVYPNPVQASPDGTRYAFFDIDFNTGQSILVVRDFKLGTEQSFRAPQNLPAFTNQSHWWAPDGHAVLYPANAQTPWGIGRVDLQSGTVGKFLDTQYSYFAVAPSGTLGYWEQGGTLGIGGSTALAPGLPLLYNTDPNVWTDQFVTVQTGTAQIHFLPDSRTVLFNGFVNLSRPDPFNPGSFITVHEQGIFYFNSAVTSPYRLTKVVPAQPVTIRNFAPSPDGSFLVYDAGGLFVVDLLGASVGAVAAARPAGHKGLGDFLADGTPNVWSSDGRYFLYQRRNPATNNFDLWRGTRNDTAPPFRLRESVGLVNAAYIPK